MEGTPASSSRVRFVRRLVQRLLQRTVAGVAANKLWALVAVVVALGGAVALLSNVALEGRGVVDGLGGGSSSTSAMERYLQGYTTYDASLIWDSLSRSAVEAIEARGGSVTSLQEQLNQARQAGIRYGQFTYVGGRPLASGESIHFYLVEVVGPAGEVEQVPYIFTLDSEGKIVRVQ